jgi:UDP-N-acetylmuramate dehydrogenase
MLDFTGVAAQLAAIPKLTVRRAAPLAEYTRFGIGGPAAILCDTPDANALQGALKMATECGAPRLVIGGGTNLVVSDAGLPGVVIRFTGAEIHCEDETLHAQSGAFLQDVVDRSVAESLEGMQTMTGIPGYLGGAVYGNAGAYGHSIQEVVQNVTFTDGERMRRIGNAECDFRYRESTFKRNKNWIIISTELQFRTGNGPVLARAAEEIRSIRDVKYPPAMKCAGSIFKNCFFTELPKQVQEQVPQKLVREGKVPSAWFLEQVGVKGFRRGDIQVAAYHANLIYNDGAGTAADLVSVIRELKRRVLDRFGFELEEEVQYVGFENGTGVTN